MDMTTTARVGVLVNSTGSPTSEFSSTVAAIITTVSAAAEAYLNRTALAGAQTQYFDVTEGQRVFPLAAFPVTAVSGVWYDDDQTWGSDTALASTDYRSPVYDPNGLLTLTFDPLLSAVAIPRALKVTYTGGMAANTTAFIAAFPDIAGAIDQQCAFLWMRRNTLGAASISGDNGSVSMGADSWLPMVKAILDIHRRQM